jgi:hypothetical protein
MGTACAVVLAAGLLAAGAPAVAASPADLVSTPAVTLLSTIPTSDEALDAVAVDSRRHFVYMANGFTSGSAAVYNEETHTVTKVSAPTDHDTSIGVVNKTGYAYVLDNDGRVTVIKGTKVLKKFKLKAGGASWATVNQATGLVYVGIPNGVDVFRGLSLLKSVHIDGKGNSFRGAVDPGSGLLYVPVPNTGKVWIVKGTRVVSTVKVGVHPDSVTVDRSTHEAYVTTDEAVTVIKGKSATPVTTIRVGRSPSDSAVVSRRHLVYVANAGDGTVSVIKDNVVIATDTVGAGDSQLVADPANGIVLATNGDQNDQSDQAVWALHGTKTLGSTLVAQPALLAAFDRSNGRAFVTGNDGDLFELQTPTAATVTISRPVAGHRYVHRTRTRAKYTCTAGTNNTLTACLGSVPNGSRIPHRAGRHTFVVHAHSAYGPVVTKTVHYHVAG